MAAYLQSASCAFRFTGDDWDEFSNFGPIPNPIAAGPHSFATSEALYQAAKYGTRPEIQERVADAATPRDAARLGRQPDPGPDPGWDDQRIDVMRWVLRMKREANPELIDDALERTGHRPIVEISARDPWWGARPAGDVYEGENVLGRLWMELRHQIRENNPLAQASAWAPRIQVGALAARSAQQAERTPIYAGIGARQTPEHVLDQMTELASELAGRGWHLHSGGAAGADTAFASAVPASERTQFLPWSAFNGHSGPDCHVATEETTARHMAIAASLHPAWDRCDATARQFHARNVTILLGPDADTPVDAVLCWTRDGATVGGTGMAIRIANAHGIPVINLADTDPGKALDRLIEIHQSRAPDVQVLDFEDAEHKFASGSSANFANTPFATITGTHSGYLVYVDENGASRIAIGSGDSDLERARYEARQRANAPPPIDPALQPHFTEISERLDGLLPEPGECDGLEERLGQLIRGFFDLAPAHPHILDTLDRLSANHDTIRPDGFVNEPLLERLEHLERYPTTELAEGIQREHFPQSRETTMSDRTRRLSDEHDDGWAEPSYDPDHGLQSDHLADDQAPYAHPGIAGGGTRAVPQERTIDGVIDLDIDDEHIPPDWVQQMESEAAEHAIPTSTARIIEDLALYGPDPLRSEHDSRDVWVNLGQPIAFDAALPPHVQAAFDQLGEALESMLDAVTPHGFQIARKREPLLWGLINVFNHQAKDEEKAVARISQEVMELRRTESQRIREQGRDPASLELEEKTAQLESAAAIQQVFEHARDYAADFFFHENNKVWEPKSKATQTSQSENVATQISGKDFLRARDRHLPIPEIPENGTLIAVAGTKVGPSHETIIRTLDAELAKTPDMVLAHGGAKGVQTAAAAWAKQNSVPQVVFLPDFQKFPNNAIMRRDDQMLLASPERVISFTVEGQRLPRLHTGALERGIDVQPVSDNHMTAALGRDPASATQGLNDHQPAYDPTPAHPPSEEHLPHPSPHQGFIDEQKRELRNDSYAASFLDPDHRTSDLETPHLTAPQAAAALVDAVLPQTDELSEDAVRYGDDDRHPIRTSLLARIVNAVDSLTSGLGGAADQLSDRVREARQLEREDTQSEIDINRQAENREQTRYAETSLNSLEQARAELASHFYEETGRHWTPPTPDQVESGRHMTSASVDAINLVERLEQRRHEARLPTGVPIVVTALQQGADRDTVFSQLDRVHAKKPDMYIAHGNAPGVLQDVSDWAKSRKVEQVHFNLDYSVPAQLRIIKRDEAILDINPVGVVEFKNGEKTTHLADEARKNKIPVFPVRSAPAHDSSKAQQEAQRRTANDQQDRQRGASQAAGMSW